MKSSVLTASAIAICVMIGAGCTGPQLSRMRDESVPMPDPSGKARSPFNMTYRDKILDKLPRDQRKGYMEVYATDGNTLGMDVSVIMITNETVWASGTLTCSQKLRVACKPGKAYPFIKAGYDRGLMGTIGSRGQTIMDQIANDMAMGATRQVEVDVQENMVTSVRLTFEDGSTMGSLKSFTWAVAVDRPRPLESRAQP